MITEVRTLGMFPVGEIRKYCYIMLAVHPASYLLFNWPQAG